MSSESPSQPGPLAGKTIALPETRELDRMAALLESDGAKTLRCPLVAILDTPDSAPVDAWIATMCAGGFDDTIFLTGEGLNRLVARADKIGCKEPFIAALARTRRVTRGPKPARALHTIGLSVDLPAKTPTSRGVMDTLASLALAGRRIGLQLYGSDPNETLVRFLVHQGASVKTVSPYIYAQASDEDRVVDLIHKLTAGAVDVIAFTSASQIERLFTVADTRTLSGQLKAGLERTKVAAIGPVAEAALRERGVRVDIVPEQPFVMKRLTNAIVAALGATETS